MKDYSSLIRSVQSRQNPENNYVVESTTFKSLSGVINDVQKYVKIAMNEVDSLYTQRSKDAGERVKEHLQKELTNVTYKYQGSVMTDTHIKGYSDIDLLTICDNFFNVDREKVKDIINSSIKREQYYNYQIAKLETFDIQATPYLGNYLNDLKQLRTDDERILKNVYDICDITNAKSIKIRNQSLNRDVDIVTASWYDDIQSIINDKGDFRGIQVYDKYKNILLSTDFPFLSIKRINDRGSDTQGRIKKMIRFLKTLKADSTLDIDINSFDINAICYNINPNEYIDSNYIMLTVVLYNKLHLICTDQIHADTIMSVDGTEPIFRGKPHKIEALKKLHSELSDIITELANKRVLA
jgi:hypothetical protein